MSRQATVRLTMAQALVRHLAALRVAEEDGTLVPYVGGVWAIFGHGNVAGLGEALAQTRDALPVYRAHNEQAMAHAAIAYGKAHFRRRIMAATSSIGPGATNMVTAAALAHAGRLPVLLLPGDTFASRAPDPVLQQLESFAEGDATANDAFRPVSRYFDRIVRPEQILTALPRAIQVLTDPAQCGPVTLALPQDVQTLAFDCPEDFLQPEPIRIRRPQPDPVELARAIDALRRARRPLIVAGGGVLYSLAGPTLAGFAERHGVPVAESQAGKGALSWRHPLNLGAIGVTGSPAANAAAAQADLVIGVGTRLQDFTTGSHSLFGQARLLSINVQPFDAHKRGGQALVADARDALDRLGAALADWRADAGWTGQARALVRDWNARVDTLTTAAPEGLPYDAHVIGAVRDSAADSPGGDIVVCAAGTLPAELHKLWRSGRPRQLPHGLRLLVHGLRDRRRPGRQAGAARARSHRDGGRRLVPDDEFRDRHRGDAGQEAHHRRARQPRLRLHQPPAARLRRRELQQPAGALRARGRRAGAHRLRRARRQPGRRRRARGWPQRPARRDAARAGRPPHQRDRDRHHARADHARRRLVVGGRGARSVAARRRGRGLPGVSPEQNPAASMR